MADGVRLDFDGPIAIVSYDRPQKHNAFDDAMDRRLFAILAELAQRPGLRAVIWRGEGPSFSSGRDTTQLGVLMSAVSRKLRNASADSKLSTAKPKTLIISPIA